LIVAYVYLSFISTPTPAQRVEALGEVGTLEPAATAAHLITVIR
jgi:hypothetical protein